MSSLIHEDQVYMTINKREPKHFESRLGSMGTARQDRHPRRGLARLQHNHLNGQFDSSQHKCISPSQMRGYVNSDHRSISVSSTTEAFFHNELQHDYIAHGLIRKGMQNQDRVYECPVVLEEEVSRARRLGNRGLAHFRGDQDGVEEHKSFSPPSKVRPKFKKAPTSKCQDLTSEDWRHLANISFSEWVPYLRPKLSEDAQVTKITCFLLLFPIAAH